MLRHALRRLLWIIPTLVAITVASFALLSYVPDPADDPRLPASIGEGDVNELRRSRFLDLPRFLNLAPNDLRALVDDAFARAAAGGADAPAARATLARLGGAALPYLLPRLDTLEPAARSRVATALAPVAERMGLATPDTRDPDRAVAFWTRFWADRSIDFRAPAARRAARRLALHGTAMREADLVELDTFALDELMRVAAQLAADRDADRLEHILRVASHVTGRSEAGQLGGGSEEMYAAGRRWQEWWHVHRADYVVYDGPARAAAALTNTQYARWAERVVSLKLGTGTDGVPILDKLRDRAPRTLGIMLLAMLIAYAAALPLGAAAAVLRGRVGAMPILAAALGAYAIPTACLGALFARGGTGAGGIVPAAITLSIALVVPPLHLSRVSIVEALSSDWARTARAQGLAPWRIVVLCASRPTFGPLLALMSAEVASALAGAFVVESAFGIAGLGDETIRAVQTRDIGWLMTLAFATALAGAIVLLLADIGLAGVDPRLRLRLLRRTRVGE